MTETERARSAGTVHPVRIGVLASGSGTILQAILDHGIEVAVVVVDRMCGAIEVAHQAGIAVTEVARSSFGPDFDRLDYTHRLVDVLEDSDLELVVMAGFGTILDKPVHDAFANRILNTHPALLPAFPGWHAVEQALAAGVKVTGCTVHLATLEVDAGPILAQAAVPVLADDTSASLHERIKATERELYPATIRAFVEAHGS
ncbi:phosphoribosylglycinamide formyltransferase [soil metagenome]